MECRSSIRRETQKEEIASIVYELRKYYALGLLLKISEMSRSTYYYTISKVNKDVKNDEVMNEIISIYYEHKEWKGYTLVDIKDKVFVSMIK